MPSLLTFPRPGRTLALASAAMLAALALTCAALPALGQGGGGAKEDDLLSGFDAPLPSAAEPGAGEALESGFSDPVRLAPGGEAAAPREPAPKFWELTGFARLDAAYNYAHEAPATGGLDHRGLSKLRTTLRLELSLDLARHWRAYVSGQAFRDWVYQLRGVERTTGTEALLDRYQQEGELLEAWVLGTPLPSLDVKIGRQIVVWGKSDTIRVVDVLNPIDLREPGLTDLEDLRLPLTMTRASFFTGPWSFTGIAIHEIRFNKEPVPGSDFFPLPSLPPEEVPGDGGANTEYALSLGGIFSGWDVGLYWADVYDDEGYFQGLPPTVLRRHARTHMLGAAANVALGNWLLKSELARFTGLLFDALPGRSFARVDGLLGMEYAGFTDTSLTFEAAQRHLLNYDPLLGLGLEPVGEDLSQYALSYRGSYLREQLDVVLVWTAYGGAADEGTVQRYQVTYELAAALDLTGGVIVYTPGAGNNSRLVVAQDNDRVFFDLKWSF